MKPEDYMIEYCPYCNQEVAIRSYGTTACPKCGRPLVPCSLCSDGTNLLHNCSRCSNGCVRGDDDENMPITNSHMTEYEIIFAWANS